MSNIDSSIPSNARIPGNYASIDSSLAGTGVFNEPRLLIGHANGGSHTPNEMEYCASPDAAEKLYGANSMLAHQVKASLAGNQNSELRCIAIPEPTEGTKAETPLKIQVTPTQSGVVNIRIGSDKVSISTLASESKVEIAQNIATAINKNAYSQVEALREDDSFEMTLRCRWKGVSGNDIPISINYLGERGGEPWPEGLEIEVGEMSGGTGNPDLFEGLQSLGDAPFECISTAFTDTESMNDVAGTGGVWSSGAGQRWGYASRLYGQVFTAVRGTQGELSTYGNGRNDATVTCLSLEQKVQSCSWEVSAAYAAIAATSLLDHPARPLKTLALNGILPAPDSHRFNRQERETLLYDGMATQRVDSAGVMRIERAVTHYQRNDAGTEDNAFLDINTPATLAKFNRYVLAKLDQYAGRDIVVDIVNKVKPDAPAVDAKRINAIIIAAYKEMEWMAWVENTEVFINGLLSYRSLTDSTRVDTLVQPDIANPLQIIAMVNRFRQNY